MFWATSGNGYQLVLAPEGVPTISAPFVWRLALSRGRLAGHLLQGGTARQLMDRLAAQQASSC